MGYTSNNNLPGSIELQGFNSTGQQVASTIVTPTYALFTEQPLSLTSSNGDIKSIVATPTKYFRRVRGYLLHHRARAVGYLVWLQRLSWPQLCDDAAVLVDR